MFYQETNGMLTCKNDSLRYALYQQANATIEKFGIELAVICPDGVDEDEWIAVHVLDFYNDINVMSYIIQDECTNYSCPIMSGGDHFEFLWKDKNKYKRPTRLPAKLYTENLLKWIRSLLEDDHIFPVKPDVPFPSNYREIVKDIFRRMFRVYAHIYHSHMPFIYSSQLDSQFFFSLKHYLHFVDQFSLVSPIDLLSLRDVVLDITPNLLIAQQMNILPIGREKLKIQRIDTGMTSILSTSVIERSSPYYPSENERENESSLSHVKMSSQEMAFCHVVIPNGFSENSNSSNLQSPLKIYGVQPEVIPNNSSSLSIHRNGQENGNYNLAEENEMACVLSNQANAGEKSEEISKKIDVVLEKGVDNTSNHVVTKDIVTDCSTVSSQMVESEGFENRTRRGVVF